MLQQATLGIFSALGFMISLYFTLVYHKLMPPDAPFIPKLCRMDQSSCQSLLSTRDARVFGVPNFYLGLVFYVVIVVVSIAPSPVREWRLLVAGASGLTVAASLFLSYSLLVRLKTNCVLCYSSHLLNLLIFLLLL